MKKILALLKSLYESDTPRAHRFHYILLTLDILTLIFLVISTFFHGNNFIEALDILFGIYVALDYSARFAINKKKTSFFISPLNLFDLAVVLSFLAPLIGENLAFLRAARVIRLLRSYILIKRLREDFPLFKRNEDIILSITNLLLFIFVMTQLVYVTQVDHNPNIKHFVDAMYFTVTTLTTTGFGDITLNGSSGKAISIIIMIFGVSLFIRLIQTVFRPHKVRFNCEKCGLYLHDQDAVCCKACGNILKIPDEGRV
ncbi:MAG: ion transporter [Alphaproteobacteria bacterium]|nr:ion transporter [Alphaproteobacteria bacterium]MCB9984961.1 ion transporter [Micavibrio sp.]